MRLATLSILLLSAATTWQCSIDSSIPLGAPSPDYFDSRLTGNWICHDEDDPKSRGPASIYAFSDREYYVLTGATHEQEHFRGFPSRLDGERFLNLQQLGFEAPTVYTILRYHFESPAAFRFQIVDLGPDEAKPTTQNALEEWIREQAASHVRPDSDYFSCTRVTPTP
jgi:hypothetical protein